LRNSLNITALKITNFKIYWRKIIMVFEKVRSIIMDQLDAEEDKVTMDAVIQDDLGADSLDIVDLVMSFEEEFDIEIPDDQVENIKTVGDIVKYIEENID